MRGHMRRLARRRGAVTGAQLVRTRRQRDSGKRQENTQHKTSQQCACALITVYRMQLFSNLLMSWNMSPQAEHSMRCHMPAVALLDSYNVRTMFDALFGVRHAHRTHALVLGRVLYPLRFTSRTRK